MTDDEVRTTVIQSLRFGHFFVAPGGKLRTEHQATAACPWELFRGHLLGSRQTRLEKTFECWNVKVLHQEPSLSGPILSVRFDSAERLIHVCRNMLVWGWEPSPQSGRAITGRETCLWTTELVGTIPLAHISGEAELVRRLSRCIFLAVVGTSRLPITSLESPLPGFSLGQLGYLPSRAAVGEQPLSSPGELIDQGLTTDLALVERAKLLEIVLRAARPEDMTGLTKSFLGRWQSLGSGLDEIAPLVRTLFNHVALSPYTGFAENLAALLAQLARSEFLGPADAIDIVSYLLRHLVRHLTAFDLVTFHNSGADYPDALLLDNLLTVYLELIDLHLDQFADQAHEHRRLRRRKRLRRRALRQAWLIRKQCEGLRVPDLPTSPGANLRVLPQPFARVPDEQITQPAKRRKTLFANQPAEQSLTQSSRLVLRQSMRDFQEPEELCELGMAVFLDRPLGIFKRPGEVDRTPMLSYESFSLGIAERRLLDYRRRGLLTTQEQYHFCLRHLREHRPTHGFPVAEIGGPARPGAVALEDARKVDSDFLFLRTTRQSLGDFLSQYDFKALWQREPELVDWLSSDRVLMIRTAGAAMSKPAEPFLTVYDEQMRVRLEIGLEQQSSAPVRYLEFSGTEYLEQGLRVHRVWHFDSPPPGDRHSGRLVEGNVVLAPKL